MDGEEPRPNRENRKQTDDPGRYHNNRPLLLCQRFIGGDDFQLLKDPDRNLLSQIESSLDPNLLTVRFVVVM
jgi:hypothetical protein